MIQRVTVPGLFPPPVYSHASVVEAGTRLAFLAGSVPLDAEGKLVGEGDPVRQAEQVIANLTEQLRAVGSGLEHVLSSDVYVVSTETAALSAVWDVVEASGLSTGPHSSTLLGRAASATRGSWWRSPRPRSCRRPAAREPGGGSRRGPGWEPDGVRRMPRRSSCDAPAPPTRRRRPTSGCVPSRPRCRPWSGPAPTPRSVRIPARGRGAVRDLGGGGGRRRGGGCDGAGGRGAVSADLAPERRGRGLGDRFVALAKERRAGGLSLWTFQVNAPARRFYERHGFTPVQWTDGERNEEREPDVRYVWQPSRP
ncbi:hypothetical protein STENM327S_03280 [Streptomyces tendae]